MVHNSGLGSFRHPAADLLIAHLRARLERARSEDGDRGASAIEWVVIAAVVVTVVAAVGFIISQALEGRAEDVSNCIEGVDGNSESC
jgi:Flp pilus assembly pilin Flp